MNIKAQHNIKQTKSSHLQFVDVKRVQSMYLNILIIVLGMTMSCTISIIFKIKSTAELIILVASCSAPVMNTLLVFVMVKRKVSLNRYSKMVLSRRTGCGCMSMKCPPSTKKVYAVNGEQQRDRVEKILTEL